MNKTTNNNNNCMYNVYSLKDANNDKFLLREHLITTIMHKDIFIDIFIDDDFTLFIGPIF